jgi:glycine dehydrogenase
MTMTLRSTDVFARRHIGPSDADVQAMLDTLGYASLDALTDAAVPEAIRFRGQLQTGAALSEHEALRAISQLASENQTFRSYIGMGYHDTVTPAVIVRNILENPGWYTQYTPYQPEISQGRLEALLNYQTMITDLTGMDIANASLLDEGTAAAEAMTLMFNQQKKGRGLGLLVAADCHPQTLDVVRTRAQPLGIQVLVGDPETFDFAAHHEGGLAIFGCLLQYPGTDGRVADYRAFCQRAHAAGAMVTVCCDLLALCVLQPPGEFGADVAVGSAQRFGVPLGFGGPHAAFFATRDAFKRAMPGRLVGVSVDARGKPALRLALQTREQHIRRDKATSNICTAQVLLAIIASTYACYHGPDGLRAIALRVHHMTVVLAEALRRRGVQLRHERFFDTVRVEVGSRRVQVLEAAEASRVNLRDFGDGTLGIALDEATTVQDLADLVGLFSFAEPRTGNDDALRGPMSVAALEILAGQLTPDGFGDLARTSNYLTHPVFSQYHSETEMMRYLHRLQQRDLSLTTSMIPLGSCTMKLNAAAEMLPITFPGFAKLHPFAPAAQTHGYRKLFAQLEAWLSEITGFHACSLQPNAGSQGEYTGLQVIRAHHHARGEANRNVCLIPQSAHGTNPATAAMAGMQIVVVACDAQGNIDVADLKAKAALHAERLAALMVTYPSTHGVFEEAIKAICATIHQHGGQVYMDGANLNAQVGLCRPGDIGADVCHINLHKTFCIPHGGGGPGMGPICVAAHLAPYLPGHTVVPVGGSQAIGAVSAAPWGSASILPISWMYIAMMGADGLMRASQVAILSANYLARRLSEHFPILYTGHDGLVAHECIVDTRPLKTAGVEVDDIAKRLMDYGFHAPTMSFPVPGTLMIEPTESESKAEIDRFITALVRIRAEVAAIEAGTMPLQDSPLKHAPHTLDDVLAADWDRPYSREDAAFPAPWVREGKFWPFVARIDQAYGDRHLVCSCLPIEAYQDASEKAA